MDQTVVGVTPAAPVSVGDPVVIAAPPGTLSGPTIDDLATWATTINYEIVCGISPRVPRVYVRGGAVVAVADLNGYRPYSRSMDHK
jgi:alanine racemase